MPSNSVNTEKHIKTYLLNTYVITENAKLKKNVRKKTPQASTSTDPTPAPIIYNYN
jgi:CTP:phosphocholine cytidylyltransferase-like protein